MYFKKRVKSTISLVLAVVMVLSCLVFTSPTSVAKEEETPAAVNDYYYEIDVSIINCDNGYSAERTFLGPDVHDPGAWFGGADTYYKDMGGMVLWHTDENGRGDGVVAETFDFGPNGLNYVYDGGPAANYTISGRIAGFPTSFAVYNNNDHNILFNSGDVEWAVTEMRIGTNAQHMTSLWKGDCHVKNRDGSQPTRYKIDFNGDVSVWSLEGFDDSTMEVNDYTYVKNSKGDYVMLKKDAASYTANREPWELPYADSIGYYSDDRDLWNTLNVLNDESVFIPKTIAYCIDQYGVSIADPITAYDIVNYNGEDYSLAAVVDEQYIQTCSDILFDQKSGKITAGANGYVAGENADHPFVTRVSYIFGGKSVSFTSEAQLHYPLITFAWRYIKSAEGLTNPTAVEITDATLFGNTVGDSDYPGGDDTRNYFSDFYHYSGGTFESQRICERTVVEMTGYTRAEHSLDTYEQIEGDFTYHNHTCACGYAVQGFHTWNEGEVTTPATCSSTGVFTKTCTDCGATQNTEIPQLSHVWDEGVVTKEPSCGVNGIRTFTCQICQQTKTERIRALEHEPILRDIAPNDKHNGGVYYECANCGCFWGAVYNEVKQDYDIPDETPLDTVEEALAQADRLPAPYFNTFTDEDSGYAYAQRGASLKYVDLDLPDYQPLRFSQSVKVPEQVDYRVGESGNAITDIGIVYSQSGFIETIDQLELNQPKVYAISVKDNNSGTFDGLNWKGVSVHTNVDGTFLTMNLVVNVLPENWKKDYCARAYITYNYNGFMYTVYDESYSSRSVAYVAQQVVDNPNETRQARDYCQSVILDNLDKI